MSAAPALMIWRAGLARGWRAAVARLLPLVALASLGLASSAHAHLMLAQRGTLNLAGNGAFVVLSVPVSAFSGVDADGDGRLSPAELSTQAPRLNAQVQQGVHLLRGGQPLPLQGVMMQLQPPDQAPNAAAPTASQLLVMGRFALDAATPSDHGAAGDLALRFTLFGHLAGEQSQDITVSHGSEAHRLVLSPAHPQGRLFPSAWHTVWDQALQGMHHVLSGLDHLLFLLVVLAAGTGWRHVVVALSCFTLGHATTLAASVVWGLRVPPGVVEPAIAATIVGMALFDRWAAGRAGTGTGTGGADAAVAAVAVAGADGGSTGHSGKVGSSAPSPVPVLRWALVFGCALIHGLGLSGALTDMGLDPQHQWLSLLGFNLGVELAQVGVASATAVLALAVGAWRGSAGRVVLTRLAQALAVLAGSVWLVQRLVAGG